MSSIQYDKCIPIEKSTISEPQNPPMGVSKPREIR